MSSDGLPAECTWCGAMSYWQVRTFKLGCKVADNLVTLLSGGNKPYLSLRSSLSTRHKLRFKFTDAGGLTRFRDPLPSLKLGLRPKRLRRLESLISSVLKSSSMVQTSTKAHAWSSLPLTMLSFCSFSIG